MSARLALAGDPLDGVHQVLGDVGFALLFSVVLLVLVVGLIWLILQVTGLSRN